MYAKRQYCKPQCKVYVQKNATRKDGEEGREEDKSHEAGNEKEMGDNKRNEKGKCGDDEMR